MCFFKQNYLRYPTPLRESMIHRGFYIESEFERLYVNRFLYSMNDIKRATDWMDGERLESLCVAYVSKYKRFKENRSLNNIYTLITSGMSLLNHYDGKNSNEGTVFRVAVYVMCLLKRHNLDTKMINPFVSKLLENESGNWRAVICFSEMFPEVSTEKYHFNYTGDYSEIKEATGWWGMLQKKWLGLLKKQ